MKILFCVCVALVFIAIVGCSNPGDVIGGMNSTDQVDTGDVDVIDDDSYDSESVIADGDPWDDRLIAGCKGRPKGDGGPQGQDGTL